MHWRRKWQPTPVFLPGESQGRGNLVGCRLWGRTESDTTEWLSSSISSSSSHLLRAKAQKHRPFGLWAHVQLEFFLLVSVRPRPYFWSNITGSGWLFVHSFSHVRLFVTPMECSTPGLPVLHHLLEFAQTHFHQVSDAIQPSHPLSSPSYPDLNLSQHQGLFQWVGFLHQVAKVLGFQLQHQSFQWIFRIDFLEDCLVWSPCSPRDSQESSPVPQFKSINSLTLILLYDPTHIYTWLLEIVLALFHEPLSPKCWSKDNAGQ